MISQKIKIKNFEKESALFGYYYHWNRTDSHRSFFIDKCIQ